MAVRRHTHDRSLGCRDHVFKPLPSVYSASRRVGGYTDLRVPNAHRDHGHVVITNQRVFFDGGKSNRDWLFTQLVALAHGSSVPVTLMRVATRQRLSGFVFPGAVAAAFQFHLSLALAEYHQDRRGFIAHLSVLFNHHEAAQPLAPPMVLPSDAPKPPPPAGLKRVLFGPPGASKGRQLTPILLSTFVVLTCLAAALSPPADPPAEKSATGLTEVIATSKPPAPAPAVEIPSPTQAPVVIVVPTTTKPAAVESTCGAPANPWGYDFCSGGGTISSPPANFCSYFDCIPSFWESTNGYVIECEDHTFSHSGGRSGSCSHHGGNNRTLTT